MTKIELNCCPLLQCKPDVAIQQAQRDPAVEAQVDEAAELWDITDRELKEIRRSLEELG